MYNVITMATRTMLNGMKIIKRWTPATTFSSLLLIGLGCLIIPLALLAWGTFSFGIESTYISGSNIGISFTGYQFISESIDIIVRGGTNVDPTLIAGDTYSGVVKFFYFLQTILSQSIGPEWGAMVTNIIVFSIIGTIGLVVILLFISFIVGLVGLFTGRLASFKAFPVLAWWSFVFIFIESLIPLASFFVLPQLLINYDIVASINGSSEVIATIKTVQVHVLFQTIYLLLSFVIAVTLTVIYSQSFHNHIYIKNAKALEAAQAAQASAPGYPGFGKQVVNGYPQSGEGQSQVQKKTTTIQYNKAKGLPPNLTAIGGHAFTQNIDIEVAIIPNGIAEIGPSAFANCINLQVLSIPKSIKKIGYNAFFGCKKLSRINYGGKKVEWRLIQRGSNWLASAGTTTVICTDGPVTVNPYH